MSREGVSRRAVIGVAALALLGVGVVLLLPRFSAQPDQANTSANSTVNATEEDGGIPPASEALISAALAAGDITYEESLLERAYAWFDDPRLQPSFRSEIVDWEAGARLLDEVHRKEATLSKAILTELAPFRARPADPISIFNRPRADVVKAQYTPGASDWVSLLVPGAGDWTPLRVWIKGTEADLRPHMADVTRMWASYHKFFVDGWEDAGASTQTYNLDTAVDLYLVRAGETDPRCRTLPCAAASRSIAGWSPIAEPDNGRQCSGYAVVNIDMRRDEVIGTMAHELTHVAQRQYECSDNLMFLTDGSATWVGYKVLKDLGIEPDYAYDYLKNPDRWSFFPNLHRRLDHPLNAYASWTFFYYASMEFGDGIVKTIWAGHSVGPGPGGPNATNSGLGTVNKAVPLDDHFPKFALRNWNQEPVPDQYVDEDGTFPSTLMPEPRIPMPAGIGKAELDQPVARVSTRYYHYTSFDAAVRKVTIQNLYTDLPYAHLWAIKKIGTQWKTPEDWSRVPQSVLCRDLPTDDVSELVLIVSNSHLVEALPPGHPRPRVLSEDVGCEAVKGTAKATLRLKDAERNMDISYVSSSAQLRFRPRTVQDQPGNVQYDLLPTSVTWTAAGRMDGCTAEGQTVATIPAYIDQPLDPTRPAYGYLNVVGKDGGDFHSVQVSAINPAAFITKTCPGKPPVVTQEPFRVVWLLSVLSQPNTHIGNAAMFRGTQNFDPARIQNNLPMSPGSALSGLLNSPVAGFITPEIQRQMKEAQEKLDQVAAEQGGRMVYTFEWELQP